MGWWILLVACGFEITWAVAMKYSHGFERLWPTVITLVCALISFGLMALAEKSLPLSTAYIVLNGVGAAGVVVFGILLFGESTDPIRLLCVVLIVVGIIGLRATNNAGKVPKSDTTVESAEGPH
jgi:quaternary ammonium compound-resistance protein SugE